MKKHIQKFYTQNMAQIQAVGTVASKQATTTIAEANINNGEVMDLVSGKSIKVKNKASISNEYDYSPANGTFKFTVRNDNGDVTDVTTDASLLGDQVKGQTELGKGIYNELSDVKSSKDYIFSINASTGKVIKTNAEDVNNEKMINLFQGGPKSAVTNDNYLIKIERIPGTLDKQIVLIGSSPQQVEGQPEPEPNRKVITSNQLNQFLTGNINSVIQPKIK
jgi:hypothetical protein